MLFQEAPPDTTSYMILGYAVFFVISAIYVLSLIVRRRNLEQDLKTLESIEADSRADGTGPGAPSDVGEGSGHQAAQVRYRQKTARKS